MSFLNTLTRSQPNPLNNPKIPIDDPRVIEYLSAGNTSSAGVVVNNQAVLGIPAAWRLTSLICRMVGKTPTEVKRNLPDNGGTEIDRTHRAHRLLRKRPNSYMTPMVFKSTLQNHAIWDGNGYAAILRDNTVPTDLIPLDPNCTTIAKEYNPEGRISRLLYITHINGSPIQISPANMLHIKGLSGDGFTGYDLVDCMKEALGMPIAARKYGSVFFKNDGRPGWGIAVNRKFANLEAAQEYRDMVGNVHDGLDNAHKMLLLQQGDQFVQIPSMDHRSAQLQELRQFEDVQVANLLLFPPHKVGAQVNSSYNTLEEENRSILGDVYDGWFCSWEEEGEAKLLTERQKDTDSHNIEFNRARIIMSDAETMATVNEKYLDKRVKSPNEVRRELGLNPYDGGDEMLVTNNVTDPNATGTDNDDGGGQEPEPPALNSNGNRSDALDALRDCVRHGVAPLVRRVVHQAKAAASKPAKFNRWVEEVTDSNMPVFVDILRPHVRACQVIAEGSTGDSSKPMAEEWFASIVARFGEIADTSVNGSLENRVAELTHELETEGAEWFAESVIKRTTHYEVVT